MLLSPLPVSVWLFLLAAIVASLHDIRTLRIPRLSWLLPALAALLEATWLALSAANRSSALTVLGLRLLLAVITFALLWLFRLAMRRRFGMGDVWFLSALALAIGFPGIFLVLLCASLLGSLFGLLPAWRQRRLPFVPFIAAGLLLVLIGRGLWPLSLLPGW